VAIVGRDPGYGIMTDSRGRAMLESGPSDPVQVISFEIPVRARVSASIYDVAGRLVKRIDGGTLPAGMHTMEWDASGVRSGVYFMRISTGSWTTTKKVVIVR
jgi:flagellar hook assembly protein FlgD